MKKTNQDNTLMAIIIIILLILVFFGGYGMMGLNSGMMGGYYGFGSLFGFIALIASILVIYDVLVNNKKLATGSKILWIICAILFSIITAIIYYLVGKDTRNHLLKSRKGDRK